MQTKIAYCFILSLLMFGCGRQSEREETPRASLAPRLPTGNTLDPAGSHSPLGSMPTAMTLSPEGDRVVVLLGGWREQGIQVIERASGRILQTLEQPAAFIGLAFSPDGRTLYASGGNQDVVYRYDWRERAATLRDSIVLAAKAPDKSGTRYPSGLAPSRDGKTLYVAENLADSIAIVDLATKQVVQRLPAGRYPYGVVEAADGNVIVSAWGDDDIVMISPRADAWPARVLHKIEVGRHPSALLLGPDGRTLYAASASTDRVAVVDLVARRVTAQLYASAPAGPGEGSTPNALALSEDGSRLFVAEADNNAVAVWNLAGAAHIAGRIPVGWYPTALVVTGDTLLVASGKGAGTSANPNLFQGGRRERNRTAYTLGQLSGTLTTLTARDWNAASLPAMTERVARANGWNKKRERSEYPPLQYVVYVIRENRTYDQVFGDMQQADGDTSLLYFGRAVTPNAHALAERFGLFDRFFVNAEVSADGHNWSTAAYTTDYTQKTVPPNYAGDGRTYDYEGTNRDRVPADEGEDNAAEPARGYLWDLAQRAGISLRNYGEFVIPEDEKDANTKYRGTKAFLAANTHPWYPNFNMGIRDQRRADIYIAELQTFVKRGQMPKLQIINLPRDHTSGGRALANTPRAHVADNDLALGRIVEAISNTPFWKSTVIFVLEDDAQDGPDHVDSHRSPVLIISPYSRGGVNHRFANTTDVIATMTEILKLGSLSQFDYFGRPLLNAFTARGNFAPYRALTPAVDLNEVNTKVGAIADSSALLDLSAEDRANEGLFNRILWRIAKGNAPYPAHRVARSKVIVSQ